MTEETPRDQKETEQAIEDAFEFNNDESFLDVVESLEIETPVAVPEEELTAEQSETLESISEENDLQDQENVETTVEEPEEKHEQLENVVHALQDSFQQMSAAGSKDTPKEDPELVGLGLVMKDASEESKDDGEKPDADGPPKIKTDFQSGDSDFVPPTPGTPPTGSPFELGSSGEDSGDIETYSANLLALNKVDIKNIGPNTLNAREQEKAGALFLTLL